MDRKTYDELEGYIDRYGLGQIIEILSDICHQKSSHVQNVWGDEGLAKLWERNATKLEKLVLEEV